VNNVGVLKDLRLSGIPGFSVVYGGNGSGKSTLVRFLNDTLLETGFPSQRHADQVTLGSTNVSDQHNRWELTRVEDSDGRQSTITRHRDDIHWNGVLRQRFPDWVSDQAFQEILSPGYDDVGKFALLTRLCLETGGAGGSEAEIRQTEEAIAQAVREREGTVRQPGVEHEIIDLERQRDALNLELANLKRHDPALPAEIRTLEQRIAGLHARNVTIREECTRIRVQITELEQRIAALRERNRLSLDREELRALIAELRTRQNHWSEIRATIERHTPSSRESSLTTLGRSGHSIKSVIHRLEERMLQNSKMDHEHWHKNVEQETAALCNFVSQQQESLQAWQQLQESQLGSQAAASVRQTEVVLEAQIAALQEELDRADNILAESLHRIHPECGSSWHHEYQYRNGSAEGTIESLETELRLLQERLATLLADEAANVSEARRLQTRLEELQLQLRAMPSLTDIDELRARIAELDARLELLTSHRDVLLATEQTLRQVLARLRERRTPAALEIASPWLRRLTDGECLRVIADPTNTELLVETTTSYSPLRIDQLSRGTQHQLALILRLALLDAHSPSSDRLPLIIDDVFITSDDERGAAAADLLRDAADRGQQIVMLTCQNDVRALLAARGATVYSLTVAEIPAPAPEPIPQPVVIAEPDTSLVFKAFDGAAEEFPGELDDVVVDDDDSHWLFYLEAEHPVADLSGIEISELNGLTAAGITTVEHLLICVIPEVQDRIQNAGFFMTEERLLELQTQASMAVCIPMLRQRDAELLIAAGIDSVRQLAKLRPEAVYELVSRFQRTDSGVRFLRSGQTIDQQQAISWNRWALHARSLERAREASTSRRNRSQRSSGILSSSQRVRTRTGSPRERTQRGIQTQRRLVRPRNSDDRDRRRAERRRKLQDERSSQRTAGSTQDSGLKFYLERSSQVEAAPSIGPRTATRLERVGIITVADLLQCNADTVATLLDNRRITASIIEDWKSQSALVCTIPGLRGHDAQILVACGKSGADEIRNMSPEQLYAIVQPFCETSEGARIVRGGRKPDLKEVTDWINWSRQSRTLKAA